MEIQASWYYLLVLVPIIYFLFNTVRLAYRSSLRKIPGPAIAPWTRLWRVKLVWDGKAPWKYIKLHEKYGPVVRTGPNSVDISDPAAIPIIYGVTSKFTKTTFYDPMSPHYDGSMMPSMFSATDPAYHKRLKTSVATKFTMTSIRSFEQYVDQCTDIFIKEMHAREGQPVDFSDWLQYYAFDVIAALTFQRRFGFMEEGKDVDNMIDGIWRILSYAGVVGQIPEFHWWLLGNRKMMAFLIRLGLVDVSKNPLDKMMRITQGQIRSYNDEEKSGGRGDFLQWLRAEQAKDGTKITDRDIMNHLSNNLLAGSDTTAISLRAIFYYLIKTPRCYDKLVAEIKEAESSGLIVSRLVTYDECLKLPYLQAVIKEALRLHPGIGFPFERFAPAGGANVLGIHYPAGTIVGVNAHVIHRNKEVFGEDADEFRPERWIDSDPEQVKLMDRCWLVFGYGVRTCVGKNISIMEIGKLVPQVLREFDVEWASDKPEWETRCYWQHKQWGLIVKLRSKTKNEGGMLNGGHDLQGRPAIVSM